VEALLMKEGKNKIFYKKLMIFTIVISLTTSGFVLTPEAYKSSLKEFKHIEEFSKKSIISYTPCSDPVYIDDDYSGSSPGDIVDGHTFGYDAFDKIQDGVDGVCDGGTIYVYSGTYQEQVYITKNVDMFGIVSTGTKPLIQPPASASRTTYTIPESIRVFDPIIFADGGSGAIDITISNFEIDGLNDGGSNTFCGMLLRNTASGPINSKWIINNGLHSLWGTGQETMGIILYGSNTDKIVHGNTVSGFSRNGITAIDGVVSINSNIVTGNGPLPMGNWAQNGIQLSGGATGNVIGNTVSGCSILNPSWAASGILCYLSSGSVNVNSNDIIENEVNVYLASCSADVRGNDVYATGAGTGQTYFYGIVGDPGEGTPAPAPSPYMDEYIADKPVSNPIVNTIMYYMICQSNIVESDGSSGGIGIGCYAGMYGTYDIYLTIDNNDILNWDIGIELYEYAPNIIAVANIHCNNIIGNTYGIYNWLTKTFNANCNWWGDISGPYHPISNPTGLGDPVSDYIDFVPWTGTIIAEAGGPYEDDNCDFTITFDGSNSYVYCPCDAETLSYSWDFDDNDGIQVDSTEMNPTHTYPTFGEYTSTLTVTGSIYGGTNIDTATVKIYGAIADAGGPYYIKDSLKVKFDGSGSTGFEAPLTYDWDFGDGSPHGTDVSPTHTYSDYGTYTVTLTVTESGNSCFDTDITTVHFQKDPPTVILIYPEGGETLKGTVKIGYANLSLL
jgi:hypothetical protein